MNYKFFILFLFSSVLALNTSCNKLFPKNNNEELTSKEVGAFSVTLSAPERAIMEVLYGVPDNASFEESELLMAGLTTLRPKLIQKLLEQCNSIKVKRLFLYLAENSDHRWFLRIDPSKLDLGSGKRSIVKEGQLDKKYNITVPLNKE